MTQWEYYDFIFYGDLPITSKSLGLDGWELVTIISRPGLPERWVFKRPIVVVPAVKVPAKKGTR